jgi:hypothetical protein
MYLELKSHNLKLRIITDEKPEGLGTLGGDLHFDTLTDDTIDDMLANSHNLRVIQNNTMFNISIDDRDAIASFTTWLTKSYSI